MAVCVFVPRRAVEAAGHARPGLCCLCWIVEGGVQLCGHWEKTELLAPGREMGYFVDV